MNRTLIIILMGVAMLACDQLSIDPDPQPTPQPSPDEPHMELLAPTLLEH